MKQTCKTCKYYVEIWQKGCECRFSPPQFVEGYRSGWPSVQGSDWCGRYEQKNSTATGVVVGDPYVV